MLRVSGGLGRGTAGDKQGKGLTHVSGALSGIGSQRGVGVNRGKSQGRAEDGWGQLLLSASITEAGSL